jgi:preprotein translocase subunit SecG
MNVTLPIAHVEAAVDTKAKTDTPTHAIHPTALKIAMIAVVWFIVAMALAFGRTLESDYIMAVMIGLAVIFFGLTLGLGLRSAHQRRWSEKPVSFDRFVHDDVAIETGKVPGREALVELLTLPMTLALGATVIGIIFLAS